jgi:hypothetical protein
LINAAFIREVYPQFQNLSDSDLFAVIEENRDNRTICLNPADLIEQLRAEPSFPPDFDVRGYLAANHDLRHLGQDWQASCISPVTAAPRGEPITADTIQISTEKCT